MRKHLVRMLMVWAVLCVMSAALADATAVPPGEYRSSGALRPIAATLNQKMATRSGPSTRYTELGTYQQSTSIVVYQQEMGSGVPWGMVEFQTKNGLMRAYTGMKRIDVSYDVPWGNTVAVSAQTGSDVVPRRGPGENYASCGQTLPSGTAVQIYHEESGYVMADFNFPGEALMTRAWIPLKYLANYQSTAGSVYVTYTPPPQQAQAVAFNAFSAAGDGTAFVDAYGGLWMMGGNAHGEMGVGSMTSSVISPRQVLTNVVDVELGANFSMALDTSGSVFAWGWNRHGQAGTGNTGTQYVTSPGRIRLGNVVQIAAGDEHGVALISDGTVYAWGRNDRGQLANGTISDVYAPARMNVPGTVVAVAAGGSNTAVILSDGTLWIAGDNTYGQLCQTASQQPGTGFVQTPLRSVRKVALGETHAVALTEEGILYIWGGNAYGQIGDWKIQSTMTPRPMLTGVRQVEAGSHHTLAVTNSGQLYAWGRNDSGQLGDGTMSNIYAPTMVLSDVWMVQTGSAHTVAVKNDGTVWGVGRNADGELGLRNTGTIIRWTQMNPIP